MTAPLDHSSSLSSLSLPELLAALRWQMESGVSCGLNDEPLPLSAADALQMQLTPSPSAQILPMPQLKAASSAPPAASIDVSKVSSLDELKALASTLPLNIRETATHFVFGEGCTSSPPVMLIGEAPGEEEDRTGRPFVGPAGQLLTKMIEAIGLSRDDVYITNLLFWRPPGNRTPRPEEATLCLPFLLKHIELIKPKTVLLLGGSSGKAVLKSDLAVGALRHKWWTLEGVESPAPIPALVTFHPSYLLRTPAQKRESWRDLRVLKTKIDSL